MESDQPQPRKTALAHYYNSALKYYHQKQYGLALGHFVLVSQLRPDKAEELSNCVQFCLGQAAAQLEEAGRHQELLKIYESVLKAYPESAPIHNSLGEYLYRHGHVSQSAGCFLRSVTCDPAVTQVRENLDRARCRLVDRWHFTMLNDTRRNASLQRAVQRAVRRLHPGQIVLDVGAGTGLLSMMASAAGADAVYACESSSIMSEIATAVLADNDMSDRVQLINRPSQELTVGSSPAAHLPNRASLLITETLDAGLLGEHILYTVDHAWRSLLLPSAQVIPASAIVYACAVESDYIRRQFKVVNDRFLTQFPDVTLFRQQDEPYWSEKLDHLPGGYKLLSEPIEVYRVNFNDPADVKRGLSRSVSRHVIECTCVGRLDALVTWFSVDLGNDVTLSSAPGSGTCWEQAVHQVFGDHHLVIGDRVTARVTCEGHLKVSLVEDTKPTSPIHLDGEVISFLNDEDYINWLDDQLDRWADNLDQSRETPVRILDLTPFPLTSLRLARRLPASQVTSQLPAGLGRLVAAEVAAGRLTAVGSWEQLRAAAEQGPWDLVIQSPTTEAGLLATTHTAVTLNNCLRLRAGGVMLPERLDVLGVLVESREIQHMTSVSLERTLRFNCSAINMFQVQQLQDFPYSRSDLTRDLSAVSLLGRLDLRTGHLTDAEFTVPLTSGGALGGLVFWLRPTDGGPVQRGAPHRRQTVATPAQVTELRPGDRVTGRTERTADGLRVTIVDLLSDDTET